MNDIKLGVWKKENRALPCNYPFTFYTEPMTTAYDCQVLSSKLRQFQQVANNSDRTGDCHVGMCPQGHEAITLDKDNFREGILAAPVSMQTAPSSCGMRSECSLHSPVARWKGRRHQTRCCVVSSSNRGQSLLAALYVLSCDFRTQHLSQLPCLRKESYLKIHYACSVFPFGYRTKHRFSRNLKRPTRDCEDTRQIICLPVS